MHKDIRNALVDLVLDAGLARHHDVQPNVTDPRFLNHLTNVLVSNATRLHHNDALASLKAVDPSPPAKLLHKALCRGLDALDGKEQALLALSTSGLNWLAQAIDRQTPDAWIPALQAAGRPVRAREKRSRP